MRATTFLELELEVYFEHEPEEPKTKSSPGWPAVVDIGIVELNGNDILKYLTPTQLDQIEDACWERVIADRSTEYPEKEYAP